MDLIKSEQRTQSVCVILQIYKKIANVTKCQEFIILFHILVDKSQSVNV